MTLGGSLNPGYRACKMRFLADWFEAEKTVRARQGQRDTNSTNRGIRCPFPFPYFVQIRLDKGSDMR
jgi:hypothetical protein